MKPDPKHICCWHVVGTLKTNIDLHGPYAPPATSETGRPYVSRCCHCARQESSVYGQPIPDGHVDFYDGVPPRGEV